MDRDEHRELDVGDDAAATLFGAKYQRLARRTDRMFARLMGLQWVAAVGLALMLSPQTWDGGTPSIHVHVYVAVVLGGLLFTIPYLMTKRYPGAKLTRDVIAVSQMLWSALLIHLTGGRIETHFHIFGSLALLAFYRDWYVLVPATLVTAADHFLRGWLAPESIFGVSEYIWWRPFEHAGWVLFIDFFLVMNCHQSLWTLDRECEREVQLRRAEVEARAQVAARARTEARAQAEQEFAAARKMEAVGRVAAGVAHEINTPIQYVSQNVAFLARAFDCVQGVIATARELVTAEKDAQPQGVKNLKTQMRRQKIAFLSEEVPRALSESAEGLERVASIVAAMKEFTHPSDGAYTSTDLVRTIETTLAVCRSEWKYVAEVRTDFPEGLRPIEIVRDEFNQVVLNMVINATHAMAKTANQSELGVIRISVDQGDQNTVIRIADTGAGMTPEVREKIFDPFFTTKEVGLGTGQGLAIAQRVIVKRHQGSIEVESEVGVGTTFILRLPNQHTAQVQGEAA